jgi:hypothetical protein
MNWSRIIEEEEGGDHDEYFFDDEVENIITRQYLRNQAVVSSQRRRNLDAPPRWPNKRDHAAGDAQIHAYYFNANPVYSPMHFHRRYIRKVILSHVLMLR